jgi:hypothetical protein
LPLISKKFWRPKNELPAFFGLDAASAPETIRAAYIEVAAMGGANVWDVRCGSTVGG